ncbi:MAG: FtsW/RodA/SpoVE family cell cycle protein [Sulfurimonas sp.]|nr:FtsW/RodA/SpoVE family cell cycle protein [Sulfurimonas sp.]MDD5203679.1 FtsW/RodA/SpoVE family cell cycle protein [Sulfurimonas sp.]
MGADRKLFTLAAALIGISIVLSYTLSVYTTLLFGVGQFHFVIRQLLFGVLGIFIIWGLSRLDPDIWLKRIGLWMFVISTLLMIAMPFLPEFLVSAVGGAKRWIKIAGFSLAPVEFFKVGFIYFLAWSFSRKLGHNDAIGLGGELKRFAPYSLVFIGAMFIIAFVQNDLGQVVVLGLTLLFMLMFAGSSFKFFFSILLVVVSFFLFFIMSAEHRILRIKSWWALAQNSVLELFPVSIAEQLRVPTEVEPYQIGHSLNAIHNGGLFGTGLGGGTFKLGFLSEVHTDFVLAGLAEEFGFVGVAVVVFLFMWMLQRIFKVANRTKDASIYLFSLGVGLMLSFSFLVNAYGISGITPIKGISVPLLSYGGSAMFGAAVAIGMVLMASKKAKLD